MGSGFNSSLIRHMNTRIVLNAVKDKMLTRGEIAKTTKLSFPTVGTIVNELIEEGYIINERLGKFSGGRKPMLLKFVPDARYIIGVSLGGTESQVVLADLKGTFISPVKTINNDGLHKDVSNTIARLIDGLWDAEQFPWERVIGIGMGVRGSFDIPRGHYFFPGNTKPIKLADDLVKRFKVPIVLEKNANAAVLAERNQRNSTKITDITFINVDTGVSSGSIIGGHLCRGFHGNAGEFGHVVVCDNAAECSDCGQRGCLETIVSLGGLVAEARNNGLALTGENLPEDFSQLAKLARSGNETARHCFSRAVQILGRAITNLVNVINPQIIVLGGNVVWRYPEMVAELADYVLGHCWPYSRQGLRIEIAAKDKHVFLHGAVTLIAEKFFGSNKEQYADAVNFALKL